jgi:hypothetical protein
MTLCIPRIENIDLLVTPFSLNFIIPQMLYWKLRSETMSGGML